MKKSIQNVNIPNHAIDLDELKPIALNITLADFAEYLRFMIINLEEVS
jgi:hypothetical protein